MISLLKEGSTTSIGNAGRIVGDQVVLAGQRGKPHRAGVRRARGSRNYQASIKHMHLSCVAQSRANNYDGKQACVHNTQVEPVRIRLTN